MNIDKYVKQDEFQFNIVGQEEVTKQLTNIYNSNKIPHAVLFEGLPGCGKLFTAQKFTELLNSGNITENVKKNIYNLCEPYFKIIMPLPRGRGETPDDSPTAKLDDDTISEIQSELHKKSINPYHIISISKANNIKINSIRDLKKTISLNFDEVKYRTIYFHNAHLMSEEAQNALLKSLEEPPEGILFVIATSTKEKLLPTILSRCWQVKFRPLKNNDIIDILYKYYSVDKKYASSISYFSDGSVEKAIKLLNMDFTEIQDSVINIIRYSLAQKYNFVWEILSPYIKDNGTEYSHLLLELIKKWFFDVIADRNRGEVVYFIEQHEIVKKFNLRYYDVDIYNLINLLDELTRYLDNNINLNVLWLNIIFNITAIGKRSKSG